MNQELSFYEQKVRDLRAENTKLKEQLGNSFTHPSMVAPDTIIELQTRNQKLAREAHKLERSIKFDLSRYVGDTLVQGECLYRHRYERLLNKPHNHYRVYY